MAVYDEALEELHRLEVHWISLLAWLAEKKGVSPDSLVEQWSTKDEFDALSKRSTAVKPRRGGPEWTLLHFLDLGGYVHMASKFNDGLARLGTPPRKWRGVLNSHLQDGIVTFRNHLQHANRFRMLPADEQRRGLELLKSQREALQLWWPECKVALQPPPPESPLRAALRLIGPNPDDALPLVEEVGCDPIRSARNLIDQTGKPSRLTQQLEGDLYGLYEIGNVTLGNARAAMYLANVREWHPRSAARERVRRRVAKELRERGAEERASGDSRHAGGSPRPRDDDGYVARGSLGSGGGLISEGLCATGSPPDPSIPQNIRCTVRCTASRPQTSSKSPAENCDCPLIGPTSPGMGSCSSLTLTPRFARSRRASKALSVRSRTQDLGDPSSGDALTSREPGPILRFTRFQYLAPFAGHCFSSCTEARSRRATYESDEAGKLNLKRAPEDALRHQSGEPHHTHLSRDRSRMIVRGGSSLSR